MMLQGLPHKVPTFGTRTALGGDFASQEPSDSQSSKRSSQSWPAGEKTTEKNLLGQLGLLAVGLLLVWSACKAIFQNLSAQRPASVSKTLLPPDRQTYLDSIKHAHQDTIEDELRFIADGLKQKPKPKGVEKPGVEKADTVKNNTEQEP